MQFADVACALKTQTAIKPHKPYVCPDLRADVFCCEAEFSVPQGLTGPEAGNIQPQHPAAADGILAECFQLFLCVRGQLTSGESVHPEKKALPFPLHAAEDPVQAERPLVQHKAVLPGSRPAPALQQQRHLCLRFGQLSGLLCGDDESLGAAVCALLFQLYDGQDEAAALLIQVGRGRSRIFDALQEVFGQDIRRLGPPFQRLHRKACPEHP